MRTALTAAVLTSLATAAGAGDIYQGNDTGGIISWTCEAEAVAIELAAQHCSAYGKYPRITSVHRQYGDFISFTCLWTPYIARFQIPGVPTRAVCKDLPPRSALQALGLAAPESPPAVESAPAAESPPARRPTRGGAH